MLYCSIFLKRKLFLSTRKKVGNVSLMTQYKISSSKPVPTFPWNKMMTYNSLQFLSNVYISAWNCAEIEYNYLSSLNYSKQVSPMRRNPTEISSKSPRKNTCSIDISLVWNKFRFLKSEIFLPRAPKFLKNGSKS